MKNNLRVCAFVLFFSFAAAIPLLDAEQELPFDNPNITISMDFKDASLKDILKLLSIQSGMNFIASEAIKDRTMTLYFDKVPLQEAINNLFKANNLSYEIEPDSNVIIVKDMGKPQIEVETRVFYLKYASVSSSHIMEEVQNNISSSNTGGTGSTTTSTTTTPSASATTGTSTTGDRYAVSGDIGITTAVKKLLSKDGSVIEDYRTNSLIVQDVPTKIPVIAETIAKLDVPTPLVMIEVEMLDVSKNAVDQIGLKFGQTPITMTLTGPQYTGFGLANFPTFITNSLTGKSASMTPGTMNFNTAYQVTLDFLSTRSDTKFLARPRVLTLNNETAEFKIETQETIQKPQQVITQGTNPVTNTSALQVPTGVTLRVTPQVNVDTGEITMFIMPKVKDTSTSSLSTTGFPIKDPEERSSKSIVRIMDGQTVVLGGLIRNKKSETITKLPVFGDIPILGALFRNKNKDQDVERELIVFITPHIMKDGKAVLTQTAANLAAQNLPKLPDREQNTFSVAGQQAALPTRMHPFEKK